jgi:hypothetical protein
MLNKPTSMKEILRRQNLLGTSSPSFPASLLDIFAGNCQRALVDKPGMIRKSDGDAHSIRSGRDVRVALCAVPTRLKAK